MSQTIQDLRGPTGLPVDALSVHLRQENEVIRCAALRAFAANAPDDIARRALLDALIDPDPDIRTDALDRLSRMARPEDCDALRASLEGDPVREVKIAAIEALGNLRDSAAIPLLRRLVHSRCEDLVAWEDEGGDWDDWLDIQVAAVKALGKMRASEAIEDFLSARKDEFGQDIDDTVFEALSNLGAPGIGVLMQIIRSEPQRPARRAATVLARSDADALLPYLDQLLASEDAELRTVALGVLRPGDARAADLARHDPAPPVRRKALRLVATSAPQTIEAALQDPDESVQAEALALLDGKITPDEHETLVDNILMWLRHAGPVLASAAAEALPRFAPNRCEAPLLDAAADADLPLEARVASVKALAAKSPPALANAFADILQNPARQVRIAALAEISKRAETGERIAIELLVSAIRGDLNAAGPLGADKPLPRDHDDHDAAIPKDEFSPQRIRITRDGDIVEGETAALGSTLQQIISAETEHDRPEILSDDTPEEAPAKRRRRQPVEGPDDFAIQFRIDAIGVSANACNEMIEDALLHCAIQGQDDARRAAWTVLSKWPADFRHSKEVREAAATAMEDSDPIRRTAAFTILAKREIPADVLRLALDSDDALLRALAVGHLPAEAALDFLADDASAVRRNSVARIAAADVPELIGQATEILAQAERSDSLRELFSSSEEACRAGLAKISQAQDPKRILVFLEAFASLDRSGS